MALWESQEGGAGGGAAAVFEWDHTEDVSAVSFPVADGVYQLECLMVHGSVDGWDGSYVMASTNDGVTYGVNTDIAGGHHMTMRYGTGFASVFNTNKMNLSDLWGRGVGTHVSMRIVVKGNSAFIWAQHGLYGSDTSIFTSKWTILGQTVNRFRLHSNFLAGSFIKVWKVA